MPTKQQYHFDPNTRIYTHQSAAMVNPRQPGEYLPVLFATPDALPTLGDHQAARRMDDDSGWEIIDDYRGVVYWLPDDTQHSITQEGEALPENASLVPPPVPAGKRRTQAKAAIDAAAGAARYRFVSDGQLIEEEYRLTLQEVIAWRSAGSPTDEIPQSLQSWMDAAAIDAEAAASSIEQTAQTWDAVLLSIRQTRLAGKAAVDAADDQADFDAMAQAVIDQLTQFKPQA